MVLFLYHSSSQQGDLAGEYRRMPPPYLFSLHCRVLLTFLLTLIADGWLGGAIMNSLQSVLLMLSIADGWLGSAIMTSLQRCRVDSFLPEGLPSIMYAVQYRLLTNHCKAAIICLLFPSIVPFGPLSPQCPPFFAIQFCS